MREPVEVEAQLLIDRVLASQTNAHPDVVRQAIALALAKEAAKRGACGAHRQSSRARCIERVPNDAWGVLGVGASARTNWRLVRRGRSRVFARQRPLASRKLRWVRRRNAIGSLVENPEHALEKSMRCFVPPFARTERDLPGIALRSRDDSAELHETWTAWLSAPALPKDDLAKLGSCAKAACDRALAIAPGCTLAHVELVTIAAAASDSDAALRHAEGARDLEGETSRSLGALAAAYQCAGRLVEARVVAEKALLLEPTDPSAIMIVAKIRAEMEHKPTLAEKVKRFFTSK